eukprot:TRINITY_DN186_c0_g1_i1.p1 TRINITY_DN186_c0_g1~~TRINITY_DN186_c0_g1_i1.p1  ORF type:complete len:232 (-),score=49.03 TRINITY_DN186_c0_g1_i1:88-681(-)
MAAYTHYHKTMRTFDPNAIRIVHHAKISDGVKCYYCLAVGVCGGPCCKDKMYERTYVQVHENRIEASYPFLCCCKVKDHISVYYFDQKNMQNAAPAGFCSPFCTHWQCFPTCCDMCGQAVVTYSSLCCPCRKWTMFPGLDDAEEVCRHIKDARNNWEQTRDKIDQMRPAGAPVVQQMLVPAGTVQLVPVATYAKPAF